MKKVKETKYNSFIRKTSLYNPQMYRTNNNEKQGVNGKIKSNRYIPSENYIKKRCR